MTGLESELQAGDLIAGHRIMGVAGRGGMGVVYRAEQLDLERPVALKLIAGALAGDEAFRERFVRESRAAAAIDHPNVIPVYSAGEDGGRLFLAMRFVEGEDLRTLVRRAGPLEPARAAHVISQVAGALDAAHARGLVHRDIKPANVLLDGDHAYLTDFGLTKRLTGETTMTGSGHWVGTLGYISPEQIRGEPVDARTDVYALGCLLFYVLTGAAPYRRDSDEATLYAHLNDAPPDARDLAPGLPPALAEIVDRALAKDPAERYPSAGDLGRAALAAVGSAPAPPPERTVARGAAAPGGAGDEETAVPASVTPTEIAPPRGAAARVRPLLPPALSLLAGAAIVLLTAALLGGGEQRTPRGDTATGSATTPAAPATPRAAKPVKVDPRPNSIVYARERVWVTSHSTGRLIGLPADGHGAPRHIALGWSSGTTSVASGFGSLWVTNDNIDQLLRLDPATGAIRARIALPRGSIAKAAVGEGAVWVGRRQDPGTPISSIVKVSPATNSVTAQIPFGEEGVADLAAGGGYLWVTNRRRDKVSRVRPADADRTSVPLGVGPHYVAFGARRAWVTNAGEGSMSVLTPSLGARFEKLVGAAPTGVAVGHDAVWVANRLDDTVARLDPKTGGLIGQPIAVDSNPYAIAAHGARAWVTSLGASTVTRIDALRG